ncbi:GGDEF domain-containing protein [Deinococcus daejeonensis]|uniref:GGDEF domain-containing protein n=1 Tax=Deinococcus daejeonensis TaxID=1007098 RepID=A0ABQ2IZL9_9DEIO|nr:GGDEF domain-containing protein [Deinococcus daejeonensis]GGN36037.1 GGDEF domain-containing protein [Deinococcus daejeonensis]
MRPFPLPTLFVPLLLLAAAHSVSLIYSHRAGELLTVSDGLYLFVPALAALASWQAVRGARDRRLAVWAAACLTFLAGAEIILVAAYDLRDLRAPDYGVGDALYHAYYLGLVALLLGAARTGPRPAPHERRLIPPEWVLDSLITGVVVAELSWVLGLVPLLADPRTTLLFKSVNVSYVMLDVILLTLVLLRLRVDRAPTWPLVAGLLAYVAADLLYLVDGPMRIPVGLTDLLWTWGTAGQAVGFALLARRSAPAAPTPAAVTLIVRTLPYLAVLTACLILIVNGLSLDLRGRGVVWFTVTVFALVMIRQAYTLSETTRLNRLLAEQAAQLRGSRDEMEYRALHDSLTGLLNRDGFRQLMQAQTGPRTLLMLDLDGFKPVNDTHGHAAGDRVLRDVARRIHEVSETSFDAARLGGDEFALLSRAPLDAPQVRQVATRLIERLSDPFDVRSGHMHLSVSVGAAQGEPGVSPDALLGRADAALYRAKRSGGGRLHEAEALPDALRTDPPGP